MPIGLKLPKALHALCDLADQHARLPKQIFGPLPRPLIESGQYTTAERRDDILPRRNVVFTIGHLFQHLLQRRQKAAARPATEIGMKRIKNVLELDPDCP